MTKVEAAAHRLEHEICRMGKHWWGWTEDDLVASVSIGGHPDLVAAGCPLCAGRERRE